MNPNIVEMNRVRYQISYTKEEASFTWWVLGILYCLMVVWSLIAFFIFHDFIGSALWILTCGWLWCSISIVEKQIEELVQLALDFK